MVAAVEFLNKHGRIIGSLIMREMVTRFGRNNLGFLWIVGEPLLFCFGVLIMWTLIKSDYENGVRIAPFVMTGYMALMLFRHQISLCMDALKANIGLLHHRQISVLHLYISRCVLEFLGTTTAFVVVYFVLLFLNQVDLPKSLTTLYGGWLLLFWLGSGLAIFLAALALRFEVMEKLVPIISYALIPISGAFFMVDWLPAHVREMYMYIPLPHGIEMIRAGVFGEFVKTHYNIPYALVCGGLMNAAGMLLLANAREYVEVE